MNKVYAFNQKNNQFKLDEKLEQEMVTEEIKEFFDATTLAERIDAMVDVRYVYEGSQMKYANAFQEFPKHYSNIIGQFHRLSTTIVAQELGAQREGLFGDIMDQSWEIVCEINAEKNVGNNSDGKVMKQDDLRNATEEISDLIEGIFLDNPLTN